MQHRDPQRCAAVRWIPTSAPEMASAQTWASTGSPKTWRTHSLAHEPVLLLPQTPNPWSFWLGILQHVSDTRIPIILFKNAIPLFETNVLQISRAPELDADTWNAAALQHWHATPASRACLNASQSSCRPAEEHRFGRARLSRHSPGASSARHRHVNDGNRPSPPTPPPSG